MRTYRVFYTTRRKDGSFFFWKSQSALSAIEAAEAAMRTVGHHDATDGNHLIVRDKEGELSLFTIHANAKPEPPPPAWRVEVT